jgi:hypothetical protein
VTDALDRILADLKRLSGSAVAGALDGENATKMAFQEFGAGTDVHADVGNSGARRRRTLTPTTDRLTPAIFRKVTREVGAVLDGKGRGTTGQEICGDAARDLAEEVQNAIDGNVSPPLKSSTLAARRRRGQGDRTLVASGEMLRNVGVETSADPDKFKREADG